MRIGVDLGGTKIEAIALDEEGRELARMLFDLENDPHELSNVADETENSHVVDRLRAVLRFGLRHTTPPLP